jgi:hypothetical protein
MKLEIPDDLAPFAAALQEELATLRALREAALSGGPADYARFEEAVSRSTGAMQEAALAVVRASQQAEPPACPPVPERPSTSSRPLTRRSPRR